ncbi:hypothetical protein [Bradyrhizobium septentrionale]|uniref:Uncharacterized protein n=1 Tax=Bradyrhizobium septentrionale TaxID=1404411 RepID=A0A974A5U8_9BRAD|nr:hypothetical protein [Bradyrhizobium septentrionale]UGY18363.1 hypothetical protein HAP48_0013520 [Bradyrhizobium septentrionale]UGY27059.1 hypothetical protein HU675_0010050 [Bradyrhizobium septentrionale]
MQATQPRSLMGKATQFPVGAPRLQAISDDHFAEQPYLIDPTRTDPELELLWLHHAGYSIVEAAVCSDGPSILGSETIRCVALNRLDLVQSRTVILNRLKLNRTKIMEDLESDLGAAADPALIALHVQSALRRINDMKQSCGPEQPFSAMARAFVDAFEGELQAWMQAKLVRDRVEESAST